MPRLQALANHGELFLDNPAATPLVAEHFDMSVFAGSHKHDRLPIPYVRGGSSKKLQRDFFNRTLR